MPTSTTGLTPPGCSTRLSADEKAHHEQRGNRPCHGTVLSRTSVRTPVYRLSEMRHLLASSGRKSAAQSGCVDREVLRTLRLPLSSAWSQGAPCLGAYRGPRLDGPFRCHRREHMASAALRARERILGSAPTESGREYRGRLVVQARAHCGLAISKTRRVHPTGPSPRRSREVSQSEARVGLQRHRQARTGILVSRRHRCAAPSLRRLLAGISSEVEVENRHSRFMARLAAPPSHDMAAQTA